MNTFVSIVLIYPTETSDVYIVGIDTTLYVFSETHSIIDGKRIYHQDIYDNVTNFNEFMQNNILNYIEDCANSYNIQSYSQAIPKLYELLSTLIRWLEISEQGEDATLQFVERNMSLSLYSMFSIDKLIYIRNRLATCAYANLFDDGDIIDGIQNMSI